MTPEISPALLAQLGEFVNTRMGLHFPEKRRADLARGITQAAYDFGFDDPAACIRWLLSAPLTPAQVETLADHLTIGETYFFRERSGLEALQLHILPPLIEARRATTRHLKLWSAGCSTGEEPYSIAILLDRYFPLLADWKITLLATDINPRFLQKAKEGVYREWSFRDTPAWVKERYFTQPVRGEYHLLPHLKDRVTFASLNLMEDLYPSFLTNTIDLDVIFCRNVLIYFDQQGIQRVAERFYRALTNGGRLIVSSTETSAVYYPQFIPERFQDVFFYKKEPGHKTSKMLPLSVEPSVVPVAKIPLPVKPPAPVTVPVAPPPPELTETLYRQAEDLYRRSRYAEVISALEPVLAGPQPNDQKPDSYRSKAFSLLVRAYANQGLLAQARLWCEKAIAAHKLNSYYYYLLGTILQEQGELDEAAKVFKRVLYLEPDYTLAMTALANLFQRRGKIAEAARYLENALQVLKNLAPEAVLFGSDNVTAKELIDVIQTMRQ